MGLGKVRARRAIRVNDAFGEKIANSFSRMLWHVGGENVIEAAIFTNDDDDMLNRASGLRAIAFPVGILDAMAFPVGIIIGIASGNVREHRKCEYRCAYRCAQSGLLLFLGAL